MLHHSLNYFREETQAEPYINIVMKAGHANTVLSFLIAHEIPFTLTGAGQTAEKNDSPTKETSRQINEPLLVKVENLASRQRQKPDDRKKKRSLENVFRKYIIKGIENIPPNMEEIAVEAGLSLSQFKTLFKKQYGKPFYQIYVENKMAYAAQLLREGHTSVVVSERIGYMHPIKFNKMFQKYFGMTPYKYQKQFVIRNREIG